MTLPLLVLRPTITGFRRAIGRSDAVFVVMVIPGLMVVVLIFKIAVGESSIDTYILQYLVCLLATR